MGCLFLIMMLISPRLGIIFLWAFTNYVEKAFNGAWIWPLLGLIFLPWTTLLYILVAGPVGGISFWGWLFIARGLLLDVGSTINSYASRDQAYGYYRRA